MINLMLRSVLVLALLFGVLFAVGMVVITYLDAPLWVAVVFAIGIILLQYLLGPWILQLIYRIEWRELAEMDPQLSQFVERVCREKHIPVPRFGHILDGNPNAFTFGHYPGDARLVLTSGLLERLDEAEVQAVVAHELGHIAHWDFVVMTVAAVVPLLLYVIGRTLVSGGGRGKKGKDGAGYLAIIGLISYAAYILSHYIVLLLSRVREYYADQFAGEVTRNPNALSTGLVKVAYGLSAAPKEKGKDDIRMVAARAFGIFDPNVAQSLALASAGSGEVSAQSMENAMKWDLWNPWALIFELRSSHPLPAKRIRLLERQSEALGQIPRFSFRAEQPESFFDEFLVDVFISLLPLLGLVVGAVVAWFSLGLWGMIGLPVLLLGVGWWLKRWFSYRHQFDEQRDVKSLISEVKVSALRSIPCSLQGEIIGRGIPGLFYSEDLVMQDQGGFIVLDYRQPIRFLEFLFGWVKAESLIGKRGVAKGWYRRSPRPYFELRRLELDNGERVTSYSYPVTQFFVYVTILLGAALLALNFAGTPFSISSAPTTFQGDGFTLTYPGSWVEVSEFFEEQQDCKEPGVQCYLAIGHTSRDGTSLNLMGFAFDEAISVGEIDQWVQVESGKPDVTLESRDFITVAGQPALRWIYNAPGSDAAGGRMHILQVFLVNGLEVYLFNGGADSADTLSKHRPEMEAIINSMQFSP